MQHEATNGRDPICNMKLPMVGTLYVTRDSICNGTLSRPFKYLMLSHSSHNIVKTLKWPHHISSSKVMEN